jgi:hypothetical protein
VADDAESLGTIYQVVESEFNKLLDQIFWESAALKFVDGLKGTLSRLMRVYRIVGLHQL